MTIQRYNLGHIVENDDDGLWVRASDYDALGEYARLRADTFRLVQNLSGWKLVVTTPNGDCQEFQARGERANRVLRDAAAALAKIDSSAARPRIDGERCAAESPARGERTGSSLDGREESGTGSNPEAVPLRENAVNSAPPVCELCNGTRMVVKTGPGFLGAGPCPKCPQPLSFNERAENVTFPRSEEPT